MEANVTCTNGYAQHSALIRHTPKTPTHITRKCKHTPNRSKNSKLCACTGTHGPSTNAAACPATASRTTAHSHHSHSTPKRVYTDTEIGKFSYRQKADAHATHAPNIVVAARPAITFRTNPHARPSLPRARTDDSNVPPL